MTGRDSLVSNPDITVLHENMSLFFHRQFDQLKKLNVTVKKTKTWDPDVALSRTSENKTRNSIIRYFYRGFVQDYVVYDKYLVDGCRMGYLRYDFILPILLYVLQDLFVPLITVMQLSLILLQRNVYLELKIHLMYFPFVNLKIYSNSILI